VAPKPKDGEVLVKNLWLSLDPYMRGRMSDAPSYAAPVAIDQVMEGGTVSEVVASNNADYKPGDKVLSRNGWQTHAISNGKDLRKLDPAAAPLSYALGILGMPGMTAYFGLAQIGKPKAGETLVVAGCLVERFRNDIRQNIPEVDAVVGTGELEAILAAAGVAPAPAIESPFRILQSRPEGDARASQGRFSRETWDGAIADLPNYLYDEATPRVLATPRHTAYIKIAEGCDHPCTFCIIPQLRGKFRSRRFESVVREAENLAAAGVREVTLIGQDTTSYGEDLGLRDGLALLLERLAGVEGLQWVRAAPVTRRPPADVREKSACRTRWNPRRPNTHCKRPLQLQTSIGRRRAVVLRSRLTRRSTGNTLWPGTPMMTMAP
jgi:hypothetical protein